MTTAVTAESDDGHDDHGDDGIDACSDDGSYDGSEDGSDYGSDDWSDAEVLGILFWRRLLEKERLQQHEAND